MAGSRPIAGRMKTGIEISNSGSFASSFYSSWTAAAVVALSIWVRAGATGFSLSFFCSSILADFKGYGAIYSVSVAAAGIAVAT